MSQLFLQAQNMVKTYGIRTLFRIEALEVRDGDRIGLVGSNGAGKSTLFDLLCGEVPCDSGVISRRCENARIRQSGEPDGESDARHLSALSLGGRVCKSGGERTREAIAAALSRGAPLLFADEPTTNLDLEGIERLQEMLLGYKGAVVLISHDRALLDRFCTTIWALEDGALRVFHGSYSDWLAQRRQERAFAQFEYDQFRAEKRRLEAEISNTREAARGMRKTPKRMGNSEARLHKREATHSQGKVEARAKAMQKRAEQLEVKERPTDLPEVRMALGAANPITAKIAARVDGLTVRYGARMVLNNAAFTLPTGKRTVMLGANGAGKTTLLNHLVTDGDCARFATGVRAGYFSQNHEVLDPAKTVLENAREQSSLMEHEVRTILANLGLAGDDVFKPASALSGGERAKAAFARLIASDCNLLVLDEPTNHIDLYTADALEALLARWQGTLLVVTHDRLLAERVAQRLLFVEEGGVHAFEGSWADWQAEQARRATPVDDGLSDLIEQMRRAADAAR